MDIRFITTLVLLPSLAVSSYVSKACFGSPGLDCTKHSLICKEGKIAIQDVYYTNNSQCPNIGLSNCHNISVDDISVSETDERKDFNATFTKLLYINCSLERSCQFKDGKKRTVFNFSVVKYICINESRNICDGTAFGDHNKSLLWNKTSHMNESYTCSCRISSNNTEPTAVYALDMRPRSACTKLSMAEDGQTYKNCTQNIQYQLLANTTWTIILEPVDLFDILWINIRGNFEVNCSTSITSTTTISTITSTTTTHTTPTPTTTSTITPTPTPTSTTTSATTSTSTSTSTTAQNTGAIAVGVIGVLVVCAVVAAVVIWFKFMRNKKQDKGNDSCALSSASITDVQHGGSRKTTSNYENATLYDKTNPVARAQNDYALVGIPSTQNGTSDLTEDDYNHINHNSPQSAPSYEYDTTASAPAAVKKLNNASSNSIDDDDYNHLGDRKLSVVSSDYDTTVSASKAVAQLGEMKDSEDDYDHFKGSEDRVIDSPYDTANDHSSVSADTTISPYDLAK